MSEQGIRMPKEPSTGPATPESNPPLEFRAAFSPLTARIMIVDDESICVKALRKYLRDAGYEHFFVTCDSSEAIPMMKRERPDLLLLDYMMPEVNGIEILRMRRNDGDLQHVPVLMLTAARDAEIKVKALELGATDFLSKPVDPNELLPRVRNALVTKAHRDELAQVNVILEEKVREQTKELRGAYVELQGLDRLKSEFLTLVSHELRTPITGIWGAMELLSHGLFSGDEERNELIGIADAQAHRLARIVEDVEVFLRLTAGRVSPCSHEMDLKEVVERKAEDWGRRAAAKGLALEVMSGAPLTLCSDPRLLEGSVDRLIDNAIKFTERGAVRIGYRREGQRIIIEVIDTGCGIDEAQQSRLLSRLMVAENIDHHQEGRGLGLAIVQRQLQLINGFLELESQGKDRGSTFRLVLPGG